MNLNYEYVGIPFTPQVAEKLIPQLFSGKTKKRLEIQKEVYEFHLKHGGQPSVNQQVERKIKKALEALEKAARASNPTKGSGYWKIKSKEVLEENHTIPNTVIVSSDSSPESDAQYFYGSGENFLYLYYYSAYKELAECKGQTRWPCKIGISDVDPIQRVLSQTSTALPEKPVFIFAIKTDKSKYLEDAIHNILHLRNRHANESPGKEWFFTNPEEVIEIVKNINPEILNRDIN